MFISDPVTIGRNAVKKSSEKVDAKAAEVVKATLPGPDIAETEEEPEEIVPDRVIVERAFIELRAARADADAAAKVLQRGGETLGSLLNVKA